MKIYEELEQGSPEWRKVRAGKITGSIIHEILTPAKLEPSAQIEKVAARLASERIMGMPHPSVTTPAMERGHCDEVLAREMYANEYNEVKVVGFIQNRVCGIDLGCSPDGLFMDGDGGVEFKSREPKFQTQVIIDDKVPLEHEMQCQFNMMVSSTRQWDYVSYCEGMHLFVKKLRADTKMQAAMIQACAVVEEKIEKNIEAYERRVSKGKFLYIKPIVTLED